MLRSVFMLYLLVSAGLLTCVLHLPLLPLRFLSLDLFRRGNIPIASLFWPLCIFMLVDWAGVKVVMYGEIPKRMKAIAFSNHRSNWDWAIGWLLAQQAGAGRGAAGHPLRRRRDDGVAEVYHEAVVGADPNLWVAHVAV